MADIFDEITSGKPKDIFDEVATKSEGEGILSQIAHAPRDIGEWLKRGGGEAALNAAALGLTEGGAAIADILLPMTGVGEKIRSGSETYARQMDEANRRTEGFGEMLGPSVVKETAGMAPKLALDTVIGGLLPGSQATKFGQAIKSISPTLRGMFISDMENIYASDKPLADKAQEAIKTTNNLLLLDRMGKLLDNPATKSAVLKAAQANPALRAALGVLGFGAIGEVGALQEGRLMTKEEAIHTLAMAIPFEAPGLLRKPAPEVRGKEEKPVEPVKEVAPVETEAPKTPSFEERYAQKLIDNPEISEAQARAEVQAEMEATPKETTPVQAVELPIEPQRTESPIDRAEAAFKIEEITKKLTADKEEIKARLMRLYNNGKMTKEQVEKEWERLRREAERPAQIQTHLILKRLGEIESGSKAPYRMEELRPPEEAPADAYSQEAPAREVEFRDGQFLLPGEVSEREMAQAGRAAEEFGRLNEETRVSRPMEPLDIPKSPIEDTQVNILDRIRQRISDTRKQEQLTPEEIGQIDEAIRGRVEEVPPAMEPKAELTMEKGGVVVTPKTLKEYIDQHPLVYHGTPVKGLKKVDPFYAVETSGVAFFTDNPDVAEIFRYPREYGEVLWDAKPGSLIKARINLKNPMVLEGRDAEKFTYDTTYQGRVVQEAKSKGFDGLIIKDVKEGVGDVVETGTTYAVFDAKSVLTDAEIKAKYKAEQPPTPKTFRGKKLQDTLAKAEAEAIAEAKQITKQGGKISVQEKKKLREQGMSEEDINNLELMRMGPSPEIIIAWGKVGAIKVIRGAVDFAVWSESMVRDFGEQIRPHLQRLWDEANAKASEWKGLPEQGRDLKAFLSTPAPAKGSTQGRAQAHAKDVISLLETAKSMRPYQNLLYTRERAKRVGKAADVLGKGTGEEAFTQSKKLLAGEMEKVQFEAIRDHFSPEKVNDMFDIINTSDLDYFGKINAAEALTDLLNGKISQPSRLKALEKIYGPELIKALEDKRTWFEKMKGHFDNYLNLPRAMMATADLSAPLRQGVVMISRPKQFGKAFGAMFKYFASDKAYEGLNAEIQKKPIYKKMQEAGVQLTDLTNNLNAREEAFRSNLAEKLPAFGWLAKASNRAYSGFLNKLRADVFEDLYRKAEATGQFQIDPETKLSREPQIAKDLADFVNAATGRGDLGKFERAAGLLNGVFFSPRLLASRLQIMNPVTYVKMDKFVRQEALKTVLGSAAMGATVLTLAKMAGADVGTDPRSADFGKIKVGNTRYDIWGGFQQWIVGAFRLATGKAISSATGKEMRLGKGYKATTRWDIIQRIFESKASPLASFVLGFLKGKDAQGDEFKVPVEVAERFIPIIWQDVMDLSQDKGFVKSLGINLPEAFGVGVQTYGDKIPYYSMTETGKETVKWREKPSKIEKWYDKVTGNKTREVPAREAARLKTLRDKKMAFEVELDKVKNEVEKTGKARFYRGFRVFIKNGEVVAQRVG